MATPALDACFEESLLPSAASPLHQRCRSTGRYGLFLVRLLRGSQIKMEQICVDDGIWMPERVEVRAAARIFFVKSLVIERVLIYSEYKRPQVGAQTQEIR